MWAKSLARATSHFCFCTESTDTACDVRYFVTPRQRFRSLQLTPSNMSATATMTQPAPVDPIAPGVDVELMSIRSVVSREAGERDPLLLRTKIKSDDEIKGLRSRGKVHGKLAKFYDAQNGHIDSLLKPLAVHTAGAAQEEENMALKVKIAVNVSFAANIILAGVQLYAAISSMSLALFASTIDAGEFFPTS